MQEGSISAQPKGEIEKIDVAVTVESDYLLFTEQNNDVCFVLSMKEANRAGILVDWDYGILIDSFEVIILRAASYLKDAQRTLPPQFSRKYMEIMATLLAKEQQ